jgi:hypothetical protein
MKIAAAQSTHISPHGNLHIPQQCHIPLDLSGHAACTLVSEGVFASVQLRSNEWPQTIPSRFPPTHRIHHQKAILTHDHSSLMDAKTLDGSRNDQNHHYHHHSQCLGRIWNRSRFASPRIVRSAVFPGRHNLAS